MKRRQVFVRAIKADGTWGNVDALDLDDESFRAWILDRLFKVGLLTRRIDEDSDEPVILKERTGE